ncbi:hypothetical protein TW95_gp0798 [Pandoravirus inopinatum]|uniref:Uncharacterized protein n=1 Tax=Pandoravirus inopinatum TaxID=1605721 RepID=A0A0B5JCX9_9VIRU|nr:hypothetical protein TW95_gp0798 [Pandoravirus inopinatum]AJF97532.1 hypothetical protein [Pandoravirus inopinatum]
MDYLFQFSLIVNNFWLTFCFFVVYCCVVACMYVAVSDDSDLSGQATKSTADFFPGADQREAMPAAVARLFAPAMPPPFVRPNSPQFEVYANQRRTRGFHDKEVKCLCYVLDHFAAHLVGALCREGHPVPAHLEAQARVLFLRTIAADFDEDALVHALSDLLQGWPVFARWFARFAVPRIRVFGWVCHEPVGGLWDWTSPAAIAGALLRVSRGEHDPNDVALFRESFYNMCTTRM